MSMQSELPSRYTRYTGGTTEQVIAAQRCILYAIIPSATTTGTVTMKDADHTADGGAITVDVAAIGLTQQGKQWGPNGIEMTRGITLTLSAGADVVTVVWGPYK